MSTNPAIPALPARPMNGASTQATLPDASAISPTHSAYPMAADGRDRVARQRPEGRAGQPCGQRQDGHRRGEDRHVRGQLLERDPPPAERGGGDELEAPPPGFAGQRAGERQDRPDRGDEHDVRAVLPGDVAADRADVDRRAAEPLQDRRDLRRQAHDVRAGFGCRVDRADARAGHEHHPAEEPGDDDEGQARVADRLGVDAAEAVDAMPERDGSPGRDERRRSKIGRHVRPPSRRRCTRRGTSPPATARG